MGSYLIEIIKGIFIGAGAILPGISSGVLCVSFGIYEILVNAILGFFSNVKENLKFLLPVTTGVIIGVFLFGNILKYLYINYAAQAKVCFAVLILSSIPSIIKKAEIKKIRLQHILALLLTLSFSIYLVTLENSGIFGFSSANSYISLIISGIIMSVGVVVPGVSKTVILMLIGKYDMYLSAVAILDFNVLFPIGIGLCLGSISLLFLIKFLLNHYKSITYFAIIGFVLGSIPVLL